VHACVHAGLGEETAAVTGDKQQLISSIWQQSAPFGKQAIAMYSPGLLSSTEITHK